MERKFTDDEIVKALECCCDVDVDSCNKCPIYPHSLNMTQTDCMETAMRNALDLINRQKAEREMLLKECKKCGSKTQKVITKLQKQMRQNKIEAIKEFAERVKKEIRGACFAYEADSQCEYIDNLVKEMTGENNGN